MPMTLSTLPPPTHERPSDDALDPAELLDVARHAVNRSRRARNQREWLRSSTDDIVSDVVEACLRAREAGTTVTARYVVGVADNLVRRDRDLCSTDARALRMLGMRVADLEQQQGGEARPSQIDAIARQIVEGWDAGSRSPTRDFHRRPVHVSLDAPTGAVASLVETIPAPSTRLSQTPEDLEVLIREALAAQGKAGHSVVRRACWDTLAKAHGAPTVSGPVVKNQVTRARTVVIRHPDGPHAALDHAFAHTMSGTTTPLTEALFTPFQDADSDGRARVVGLLRRYRSYAVDLWSAALSASSTAFFRSE